MMVFNMFYFYMQSQNRQVITLIQRNEIDELANLVMQHITNDIKSAKRGTVRLGPATLVMDRYIEEAKDTKKSAQLALMKVEYLYDAQKRRLTRNASKYDPASYDGPTDAFRSAPALAETKTFDKISAFVVSKIAMSPVEGVGDMDRHMLGVDVQICAESENVLTHVSQKSYKEDQVYIRDEIAFKNQPFWNSNPKYMKVGPISLKFAGELSVNMSQAEIIQWINSQKKDENVRRAFEIINNKVMLGLSQEALNRVSRMDSSLMANIAGGRQKTGKLFIASAVHDYPGRETAAVSLLVRDYVNARSAGDCRELKARIQSRSLDETEIKNLIKSNKDDFITNGIISASEYSSLDESTSSVAVISKVANMIYKVNNSGPDGTDGLPQVLFKYVESMSAVFADDIKKQMCAEINVGDFVNRKSAEETDPAIEEVLNIIGVKSLVDEADKSSSMDSSAKAAIKAAVDDLRSWLKSQVTQKMAEFKTNLLAAVTKSVSEGSASGQTAEDIRRQQEQSISGSISGAIKDSFTSVMIVIAKNLLLGNKYDDSQQTFVNAGRKDYLAGALKDFGYTPADLHSAEKAEAVENNEQIRRVRQIMNPGQ